MSFDRYCCICRPFENIVTVLRVKICLLCLSSLSCGLSIVMALTTSVYHLQSQTVSGVVVENTTLVPQLYYVAIDRVRIYHGQCYYSDITLSKIFNTVFHRIYETLYIISFIINLALYALIYSTVLKHRKRNEKRRQNVLRANTNSLESSSQERQLSTISSRIGTGNKPENVSSQSLDPHDRIMYENIRTAAMLFVVIVFLIISFLPYWFAQIKVVPTSRFILNTIYLNNVANPFIYCFMNQNFRQDVKVLVRRLKAFFCHESSL